MPTPSIGETRPLGFNRASRSGMLGRGQFLAISSNTTLISIISTNCDGNGTSTFALANVQWGSAVGMETGADLSIFVIGGEAGVPAQRHAPYARLKGGIADRGRVAGADDSQAAPHSHAILAVNSCIWVVRTFMARN